MVNNNLRQWLLFVNIFTCGGVKYILTDKLSQIQEIDNNTKVRIMTSILNE